MAKRVQSPSSINLYKQCPRRYFYQYILKLPTKSNIHLLRGNILHETLEKFYSVDIKDIDENNYVEEFTNYLKNLFDALWSRNRERIIKLGLTEDQLVFYYEESIMMLANWLNHFFIKIRKRLDTKKSFREVFEGLKPKVIEEEMKSEQYKIHGFIDYIEETDGEVKVMDYKTSKSPHMTPEYKLQLAIYALLYNEKYGKMPNKVGLYLFKHGELTINATKDLLELAKFEIEQIHSSTETDNIEDYPKKEGPLCIYSTGRCDFYDVCCKERK